MLIFFFTSGNISVLIKLKPIVLINIFIYRSCNKMKYFSETKFDALFLWLSLLGVGCQGGKDLSIQPIIKGQILTSLLHG